MGGKKRLLTIDFQSASMMQLSEYDEGGKGGNKPVVIVLLKYSINKKQACELSSDVPFPGNVNMHVPSKIKMSEIYLKSMRFISNKSKKREKRGEQSEGQILQYFHTS